MTEGPLVTVYITNYNYDQYLARSIESVLDQTFQNFELVIIDDGSTDSSREIIWRYQENPKTRIIYQENKGLVASINIALRAARGKYVIRLDADDYLDPNALLVMTEVMEQNQDLALVFPDYYYIDKDGNITGQERRNDFEKEVTLYDLPAHGACTLFRKKVLLEIGAYNDRYSCQDGYDIWLKLIKKYPVKNINLPLFYYRRHGKNLTDQEERILITRQKIKSEHAGNSTSAALNCIAVVPVRGRIIDPECPSLEDFGGIPLLEWTLREVDHAKQIQQKIVSTPDPDVAKYIEERGQGWSVHIRSRQQAIENVPLRQTLIDILNQYQAACPADVVVQVTPESPFRTWRSIEEAIDTLKLFDVDLVVAVIPEDGQLYWHRGRGLEPVSSLTQEQNLRLERERLYRKVGGLQVMKTDYLVNRENYKQPKIGHIILDKRSAAEIVDQRSLKEALSQLTQV